MGNEVEGIPEELSKKERKAWRDRATQLRHARHEAGKKGGEAPGIRGTKASRSKRAPIKQRAGRRGGGHGIAVDEEVDGEPRGKGNRSKACSCAVALGTSPEVEKEEKQDMEFGSSVGSTLIASGAAGGGRRGAKQKVTSGACSRGEGWEEDEAGTWGAPRAPLEEQGKTGDSVPVTKRATDGKRGRTKSGVVSGGRTAAKGSEEAKVATRGGSGSSSNERNGEDGVTPSLSAKAETGRPPGRPKVRRARCRQEVGRAGNKVGK